MNMKILILPEANSEFKWFLCQPVVPRALLLIRFGSCPSSFNQRDCLILSQIFDIQQKKTTYQSGSLYFHCIELCSYVWGT